MDSHTPTGSSKKRTYDKLRDFINFNNVVFPAPMFPSTETNLMDGSDLELFEAAVVVRRRIIWMLWSRPSIWIGNICDQ